MDFDKIKYYRDQINLLIAQKPELQILQDKVDEALKKAGNNKHERCRVLQEMMLNKWQEFVVTWEK